MREHHRRDGCVTLVAENDDQDTAIVEPIATAFTTAGNSFCVCGAPIESWNLRCVATDGAEFSCARCHRVHGRLRLGTKVHH